jgi:fucose 4-O-acetylase-like acetyltransferase
VAPLSRSVLDGATTNEDPMAHRNAPPVAHHDVPTSHASDHVHARDESIDVARGITITAIVLGHVVLGVGAAHLADSQHVEDVTRGLYLFRLSTLAYLSGLFVRRGVEKSGAREFVVRRVLLFGWLYVLWSLVQGTVKVLAGSLTNQSMNWTDVLRLWVPEGQLWFLPWLMSVTLIAVVSRPWESRTRAAVLVAASSVLAVAVWGLEPMLIFGRGWALLLPFLLGCVMTARRHARAFRPLAVTAVLATVGGAIWLILDLFYAIVPPTLGGDDRTMAGVALGVVGCIAGTVACLAWAGLLARTPIVGLLAPIGRRSLEIYLAHIVVASGTRILLLQMGVDDLRLHLVAGVLLGVTVPMALAALAKRMGWDWVFGLPRALQRS